MIEIDQAMKFVVEQKKFSSNKEPESNQKANCSQDINLRKLEEQPRRYLA